MWIYELYAKVICPLCVAGVLRQLVPNILLSVRLILPSQRHGLAVPRADCRSCVMGSIRD